MRNQPKGEPITLDPAALLGLSLIAKTSALPNDGEVGRLLSKVGGEPLQPASLAAKILSKIGETGS